jgi:hypothetical protein
MDLDGRYIAFQLINVAVEIMVGEKNEFLVKAIAIDGVLPPARKS